MDNMVDQSIFMPLLSTINKLVRFHVPIPGAWCHEPVLRDTAVNLRWGVVCTGEGAGDRQGELEGMCCNQSLLQL